MVVAILRCSHAGPISSGFKNAQPRVYSQASQLRQFAREVRGFIGATRAGVPRDLGIWAEWARPVGDAVSDARRFDPVGRFATLDPLLQRAQHVKAGSAIPSSAVRHAGHHE